MRCGVLAVDRDQRLVLANRVALEILTIERPPAAGTPVREALVRHPELVRLFGECFDMRTLPNRAELELEPGKSIGFTMSFVPGAGDRPRGAALFFKDLTHIEHRAEQERLRDRLAALGEMAASMAHEIRNPLTSIGVSCSLLERRLAAAGAADERSRDLLGKIAAEVRRLNERVTSSLEYVKPVTLDLDVAPLPPVLEEALAVARQRAGGAGVEVVRSWPADLPPMLMDRARLRQVFENLFLNAFEATGERGTIRVEAGVRPVEGVASAPDPEGPGAGDPFQRFDRLVEVRVSDTGPGLDEARRSRIFHPFYTTKKQGSGVGLATAKKIVTSHRGRIDVDDAPEGGARFTVRLPVVPDAPGRREIR